MGINVKSHDRIWCYLCFMGQSQFQAYVRILLPLPPRGTFVIFLEKLQMPHGGAGRFIHKPKTTCIFANWKEWKKKTKTTVSVTRLRCPYRSKLGKPRLHLWKSNIWKSALIRFVSMNFKGLSKWNWGSVLVLLNGQVLVMIGGWYSRQPLTNHK